jgi:hypothetical protein
MHVHVLLALVYNFISHIHIYIQACSSNGMYYDATLAACYPCPPGTYDHRLELIKTASCLAVSHQTP